MKKLKEISVGSMVLLTILLSIILFIYSKIQSKSIENSSIGIIGGADGPTQIYISSGNDSLLIIVLITVIVAFIFTIIKVYKSFRKN